MMKNFEHKSVLLVSSLAMLLALGACGRNDDTAAGPAAEVKQETRDATASMGAAAGTAMEAVDDASITAKVNTGLLADKDLSAVKIDVDTKNGVVTLSGPAPTPEAKERAAEIARNVKGVSSVNNQLSVRAG